MRGIVWEVGKCRGLVVLLEGYEGVHGGQTEGIGRFIHGDTAGPIL